MKRTAAMASPVLLAVACLSPSASNPGSGAAQLAVSRSPEEVAWVGNNDYTGADVKEHVTTKSADQVLAALPIAPARSGPLKLATKGAYPQRGNHLFVLVRPLPDSVVI